MVLTQPSLAVPSDNSGHSLSDSELIQTFVEGFVHGRPVLLSNSNLRTEPLFDSMQLIDNKEGLISTASMQQAPISAKIRPCSAYWTVLHDAMMAHCFYPLAQSDQRDCYIYRYCPPSENHKIYCTTAKELWRASWGRGYSGRSGIPLDLLVWGQGPTSQREKWHALRGIDCEAGQLAIRVLGGTIWVASDDLMVWAKQTSHMSSASGSQGREGNRSLRAGMRGYLRLRN